MSHPESSSPKMETPLISQYPSFNRWIRRTRKSIGNIMSKGKYGNTLKLNEEVAKEIGCEYVLVTNSGIYTANRIVLCTREDLESIMKSS